MNSKNRQKTTGSSALMLILLLNLLPSLCLTSTIKPTTPPSSLFVPAPTTATTPTAHKAQKAKKQLSALKKQIEYLRHTLARTRSKRQKLVKALESSERSIHTLSSKLHHIKSNIDIENKKIQALDKKQAFYQQQLQRQQKIIAHQIQEAYQLRHNKTLPILWGIQTPNKVSRLLIYHQYMEREHAQQLIRFQNTLKHIQDNRQALLQHNQKYQELGQQLAQQHQHIQSAYVERQQIIQTMASDIQTQQQKLAILSANEHQLEALIKALTIHPVSPEETAIFFKQHYRKLPWPTAGKVIHHFGTRIENSEIRWKGVIIKAPPGQAVYAIAPGRVVFAGWMPRYGLLIIIDHGKGYLSLYGHNQQLYYKVGDTITQHALLAKVGDTGGQKTTSLYFGLWHNNEKLNPEIWCYAQH